MQLSFSFCHTWHLETTWACDKHTEPLILIVNKFWRKDPLALSDGQHWEPLKGGLWDTPKPGEVRWCHLYCEQGREDSTDWLYSKCVYTLPQLDLLVLCRVWKKAGVWVQEFSTGLELGFVWKVSKYSFGRYALWPSFSKDCPCSHVVNIFYFCLCCAQQENYKVDHYL